jgi:hypothetical protein
VFRGAQEGKSSTAVEKTGGRATTRLDAVDEVQDEFQLHARALLMHEVVKPVAVNTARNASNASPVS